MVFKYNLSISGVFFNPDDIIAQIKGDFIIDNYFKSTDLKFNNSKVEYGYGGISFWHKKKFATDSEIIKYEEDFIIFIEENWKIFNENGIDEVEIFIEIYFDGGQCNFEVFDKDIKNKMSTYNISMPISIYILKQKEIEKWEDEIKLDWGSVK